MKFSKGFLKQRSWALLRAKSYLKNNHGVRFNNCPGIVEIVNALVYYIRAEHPEMKNLPEKGTVISKRDASILLVEWRNKGLFGGGIEAQYDVTKDIPKEIKQNAHLVKCKSRKHMPQKFYSSGASGFYMTREWRELRYQALKLHGRKCMVCGATPMNGAVLHVDHIKPRSKFPELELELSNLQVLCEDCNLGKCNYDSIDWRPEMETPAPIKTVLRKAGP